MWEGVSCARIPGSHMFSAVKALSSRGAWGSVGLGSSGRGLKFPRESRTNMGGDREIGFTQYGMIALRLNFPERRN